MLNRRLWFVFFLICLIAYPVIFTAFAGAQTTTNEWIWIGGSDTVGRLGGLPGVYGTLGIPDASNFPGGRTDASSWTDNSGNLWLFGGDGYDANGVDISLNDLWKFDSSTNEWAWMSGSSTPDPLLGPAPGVYGTLGTPAAGNTPGSRSGAVSWTGSNGNLWLFGGVGGGANQGLGDLNDLWEFNPSTNEWTWMSGSNTIGKSGVYGTLGSPAAGNIPGGREYAVSWTDNRGNLWLFGGIGIDANGDPCELNDLWKFNPSTKEWAWMGGSSIVPNSDGGQNGVYGTLGTPAPGNIPGSRYGALSWTDNGGHFWLFSGDALGYTGYQGLLNDLWEYDPSTNEWAWMGGITYLPFGKIMQPGVYGTLGMPAPGNTPGGRMNATSWTDSRGNLWLFGGSGSDSGQLAPGLLSDLWEYSPSTNEWTWMGGSSLLGPNQGHPGVYGLLGTPAASNIPGGRTNFVGWADSKGSAWLFGGSGFDAYGNEGTLNDLWVYQPVEPLPPAATPTFSVLSGTYSATQTVTISAATSGAIIYYTTNGTIPTTDSTIFGGPITVSSSETLEATATATGYSPSVVATVVYAIVPSGTPTFAITASAATVTPGATTGNISTITVTPAGGFAGNVTLTATVTSSPANAQLPPTLSFGTTNPVNITGTSAGTATLIVTTTASRTSSCIASNRIQQGVPWYAGSGAVLACVLLFGIPSRRRSLRKMLGMLVLLIALTGGVLACGGGKGGVSNCPTSIIPGTTAGTYTITVTGTSGSTTATDTVTITVQ